MRTKRALAVGMVVAVLSAVTLVAGSPASAKGRHGAVAWPARLASCAYSGRVLSQLRVAPPRVAMDKKLAKAGGRAQYVGVRVVLQGLRGGRWVKVTKRPAKRAYAATVKVRPRKLRSVKHARLLTFNGSTLPSAYSSFRAKVTLQWYAYNGHTIRGQVSRLSSSCARTYQNVTRIDAGDGYACALMTDRSVRCWGSGAYGELGIGSTADRLRPVAVRGAAGAKALAVGNRTSCVITPARTAKCWGYNADGEVGDGSTTQRSTPVTVAGLSDVRGIFTDYDSACATAGAGLQLACWGHDNDGQMGDGGPNAVLRPKAVAGVSNVVFASTGAIDACAVMANGPVSCWGSNQFNNIGASASSTGIARPTSVADVAGASVSASGWGHNCIIGFNSGVACWGAGGQGQLGNGGRADSSAAPVNPVGLTSGVAGLSADVNSTCAVKGGHVYCWGGNPYGQLGSGDTSTYLAPHLVAGISGATGVAVGARSAYAWDNAGHVWAWGDNSSGELATGNTVDHSAPVAVSIH